MESNLKFKKQTDEGNYLGLDIIEIIQFNYDGKGTALCLADGELEMFYGDDLQLILFGTNEITTKPGGTIQKIYELVIE